MEQERDDPLTCGDLIDRGLAIAVHCCTVCHFPPTGNDLSRFQAVIVPTPDGEVRAEICCAQALTINAHEYVTDWTLPDISKVSA